MYIQLHMCTLQKKNIKKATRNKKESKLCLCLYTFPPPSFLPSLFPSSLPSLPKTMHCTLTPTKLHMRAVVFLTRNWTVCLDFSKCRNNFQMLLCLFQTNCNTCQHQVKDCYCELCIYYTYVQCTRTYSGSRRWMMSEYSLSMVCWRSACIFLSRGLQMLLAISSFSSTVFPYSWVEKNAKAWLKPHPRSRSSNACTPRANYR